MLSRLNKIKCHILNKKCILVFTYLENCEHGSAIPGEKMDMLFDQEMFAWEAWSWQCPYDVSMSQTIIYLAPKQTV